MRITVTARSNVAQEVEEVAPDVAVAVERARAGSRCRCARASRRIRSGVAVASRWTCSSASGTLTPTRLDVSGGSAAGASPTANAARSRAAARSAVAASRAWTTASGRPPGPTSSPSPATSTSPTAWSIALVLAQAAAAELEHGDADVAHGDRAHAARGLREDLERVRRARQVAVGVVEQVRRAAERGAHAREALGGGARRERLAGGGARRRVVGVQPAEPQQRGAQRERDLDQPRLGGARVGEHAERLAHLDGVARGAAEHLVHVGEQRLARQPVAARDGDDRARQLGALLARSA